MRIRVDLAASTPAYRQIADSLRAYLVEGAFAAGEHLPPVRELAVELGIHHNTVAEAYRQLAQEGWLDLKRRRGAVVLAREAPKAVPALRDTYRQRLRELIAAMRAGGITTEEIRTELSSLLEEMTA